MEMKNKRKRVIAVVIIAFIALAGYAIYLTVFETDIPITKPNVNGKVLHHLEMGKDTLKDQRNNTLVVLEHGKFVVKENRTDANSNLIELFFDRFKTDAQHPLPPILFLAGGPGSSGSAIGRTEYFFLFKELSKFADVVLLDQRGTGNSIPNLHCRNSLDIPTDIVENVQSEILESIVEKCEECAEEFQDLGIHLPSYNSYESALDIEELRIALGYDKMTLYGYSYGTELAQHYIKNFGQHVQKAIFAGAIAPDHGVKLPGDVMRQYRVLDSLIKRDPKLNRLIPDFLGLVNTVHSDIASSPRLITMNVKDALDEDASTLEKSAVAVAATFKSSWEMTLTQDHFQMMIADKVGIDRSILQLPSVYYQIANEDYSETAKGLREFKRRRMPNALFFTVNGASRYSEERWKASQNQSDPLGFTHFGLSYGRYPEIYDAFGASQIEGLNAPVNDSTQVLFIHGTLDGRTPLSQTEEIAARFPNHIRLTIENVGHNRLLNNQVMDGLISFIKDSLKDNLQIHKPIKFKPPVPYAYSLKDTLLSTIRNQSVKDALNLYEQLELKYGTSLEYTFNFGPETLDDVFDVLMKEGLVNRAIELLTPFENVFGENPLLFRDLGEAHYRIKAYKTSRGYIAKALQLNFFDARSQALWESLKLQTTQ